MCSKRCLPSTDSRAAFADPMPTQGWRSPVRLLCSHDASTVRATTENGSLEIHRDALGIFIIAEIPDPPRQLLDALAARKLAGSAGWSHTDGAVYHWHVAEQPWRRTIVSA